MHIHGLYIAIDLNPSPIQKERSHIYTGRKFRHVYREIDPTLIKGEADPLSIQEETRSHIYTERTIPHLYREIRHLYRRKFDPTCIQGERSDTYTERAKLGFKRSDNRLIFRDNNGSVPPVMGTGKSY